MKVISVAGFFSGVVTYDDQTTDSIHMQIEADIASWTLRYWVQDASGTHTALVEVDRDARPERDGIYNAAFSNVFRSVPFINTFNWGVTPWSGNAKNITDAVFHHKFILAKDDQTTYEVSVTYEDGAVRLHSEELDQISTAQNFNSVLMIIRLLCEQVPGFSVTDIS